MKAKLCLILGFICLIATACNLPGSKTPTPAPPSAPQQTWVDAPLPNAVLPLLPYKLVFHSASHFGVDEFEVKVNGVVEATTPPSSQIGEGGSAGTLFYGEYLWTPLAPGFYLIAVRALANGESSVPAEVQVTVVGPQAEMSTPLPLAPTPTFTATGIPTSPPEEPAGCTLTALVNLFCRPGPGYEPIDSFKPGQFAEVIGVSADGFYLFVNGPNFGQWCTVPRRSDYVEVQGLGCETLPILTLPPTPVSTPTHTPLPQCSDGIDNDGDGQVDLVDRQCRDANDIDEANP